MGPQHDKFLRSDGYQTYGTSEEGWWTGKQACKAALQRQLGLPERHDVPILAFIGRLDHQKGVDLILQNEDFLEPGRAGGVPGLGARRPAGPSDGHAGEHHHKIRAWIGFSNEMAHRITAASDLLLMPLVSSRAG